MAGQWDSPLPPARWQQKEETPALYWERKLQIARQTLSSGIRIGTNPHSGLPVFLTPKILSTSVHAVGGTGLGKTSFMEGIIKSLILQGHGICVITPHEDLYHRVFDFCAYLNQQQPELNLQRRVIPFDVAETRNLLGFNPVSRNARVMTYQVVALMEAIRKCWAQTSFDATPRLARWLFNTAYALIDSNLTFVQAQHMVDPGPNEYRRAIIGRISNPRIRSEWEWLSTMKPDRREERTESTLNRIKPFVENQLIRPILGQYTKTLDVPEVLAGRKILLINLAKQNSISQDDQHLLGTLIVNELLTAAFARPQPQRTPFFCFIDEFQQFVTKDMCEILDGGRKHGLHLILAHQHLAQLKEKDPEVYYSTLTNARTKVVFGGLIDEDLEILAKELWTGEFNPDEVKDEIWTIAWDPVETTRTIRVSSSGSSDSDSRGSISHQSLTTGQVYIPGSGFLSMPELSSTSRESGSSSGSSSQHGSTYSSSDSTSEVPWYEYHARPQLSSRTFRQLEEQLYIKKAQLKRQPGQHAAVLIPGSQVQLIKTATLKEFPALADRHRQEFKQACMEAAGCYKTMEEAHREIEILEEKLLLEETPAEVITTLPPAKKPKRNDTPPAAPETGNFLDDLLGNR